jgi:transcriptional regulator with XRE-family HTH domain
VGKATARRRQKPRLWHGVAFMPSPTTRAMRTKSLIAVAFVCGVFNAQLSAWAEEKSGHVDSLIQRIANNALSKPELRALYLLQLADRCLGSTDLASTEAQFAQYGEQHPSWASIKFRIEDSLVPWAQSLTAEPRLQQQKSNHNDNLALADSALKEAIKQMTHCSDALVKLNIYFIADCLFYRVGDIAEARKCTALVEQAIRACETNPVANEAQIKAVSSILNSMAYGVIPVVLPMRNPKNNLSEQAAHLKTFTNEEFQKSEKLKLRAVAMADRLSSKTDTRRRLHRDLSLWYLQLGKEEQAEQQKKILFELVGRNDDRLLYPAQVGCGGAVWWGDESKMLFGACGMG